MFFVLFREAIADYCQCSFPERVDLLHGLLIDGFASCTPRLVRNQKLFGVQRRFAILPDWRSDGFLNSLIDSRCGSESHVRASSNQAFCDNL